MHVDHVDVIIRGVQKPMNTGLTYNTIYIGKEEKHISLSLSLIKQNLQYSLECITTLVFHPVLELALHSPHIPENDKHVVKLQLRNTEIKQGKSVIF